MITQTIIRSLRYIHNNATPSVYSFCNYGFGGGITIRGIIEDQADMDQLSVRKMGCEVERSTKEKLSTDE